MERFDYELNFSDEGIMIITGPNGYGKSTILKMIDDFCNNGMENVLSYPFKTFIINCEQNSVIIKKNKEIFKINEISLPYPDTKSFERRRGFPPYLRRVGFDEYIDIRTQEKIRLINSPHKNIFDGMSFEDRFFYSILDAWEDAQGKKPIKFEENTGKLKSVIETISKVKKEIGKVSLIQEQRLLEKRDIPDDERSYRPSRIEYITVINENSKRLKNELAEIMQSHSSLSNELDSTYIKRLFDADSANEGDAKNITEMRTELQKLQEKQEKLQKYGLSEIKNVSYISTLEEEKLNKFATELSIYLQDANAKFRVFEPIINKLALYEDIVNNKLNFKKMFLSSTKGIVVESDDGKKLDLNTLSSGEQEILVLFYKLIFESDVNLLLIDEPEISLHVAWQKEIMDNFKRIVKLKPDMQVMIATHSPQIISHNWDLQIDLGGLYNG